MCYISTEDRKYNGGILIWWAIDYEQNSAARRGTLNLILSIIIAGFVIYILLKFGLYLYRPFYLSKILRKIDEKYKKVLTHAERDYDEVLEYLKKSQSDDKPHPLSVSEEEWRKRVKHAELYKSHEEEVYSKFLRLRERFINNYIKLAESITTYQRYIDVRLSQINWQMLLRQCSHKEISLEIMASINETTIILEENERKLDNLLTQ